MVQHHGASVLAQPGVEWTHESQVALLVDHVDDLLSCVYSKYRRIVNHVHPHEPQAFQLCVDLLLSFNSLYILVNRATLRRRIADSLITRCIRRIHSLQLPTSHLIQV